MLVWIDDYTECKSAWKFVTKSGQKIWNCTTIVKLWEKEFQRPGLFAKKKQRHCAVVCKAFEYQTAYASTITANHNANFSKI